MSSSKNIDLCSRCLSEFIDLRYSQSCWYFWPSFVNCCPSNLLSVQFSPPSCVNNYTLYTYTVYKGGGHWVLGLRQINNWRQVPLQVNFLGDNILHCLRWALSFYAFTYLIKVSTAIFIKSIVSIYTKRFVFGCVKCSIDWMVTYLIACTVDASIECADGWAAHQTARGLHPICSPSEVCQPKL